MFNPYLINLDKTKEKRKGRENYGVQVFLALFHFLGFSINQKPKRSHRNHRFILVKMNLFEKKKKKMKKNLKSLEESFFILRMFVLFLSFLTRSEVSVTEEGILATFHNEHLHHREHLRCGNIW